MRLEEYKYDVFRCNRCGICRGKYNDEVRYVCPAREHTAGFEPYFARGRNLVARGILEGELNYSERLAEVISTCTTCMNCVQQCGALNLETGNPLINSVAILEAMREDIAEMGMALESHKALPQRIEKYKNPYGEDINRRKDWIKGINIPNKADTMFFVGCTPSYRRSEIALAAANILNKNKRFGILADEWCCGSPLLRTGFKKLAYEMVNHNVEALKGVDNVVFTCSGCYKTFKNDYPEIVGKLPFNIIHITQYLNEELNKGKLNLKNPINMTVTYHDPCHLGRHAKVYDEPRNILSAIPGIELKEMYPTRENSWCCGAGGGVKISNPDLSVEIASDRLNHAKEVEAEAIVSACPFCKTNLLDAVNKFDEDIEIYDITELIQKSIEEV